MPFKSRVKLQKIQSLKYSETDGLEVKSHNNTFDVPFCTAFHVEDVIKVTTDPADPESCLVNQRIRVCFHKSCLLEGKIVSKTLEDFQADIDKYVVEIRKRRILQTQDNSELTASLLHEIEEVNSHLEFRSSMQAAMD